MPTVTLSAKNSQGSMVSTNVSTNEASFVAGFFSDMVFMSNTTLAQLAVDDVVAGLKNGTVAFVLPGVNILIFPVGLIVTSVWTFLGISVYTYGTIQRVGYAESYKRSKQRSAKANVSRI
jgi:hypothetical protein